MYDSCLSLPGGLRSNKDVARLRTKQSDAGTHVCKTPEQAIVGMENRDRNSGTDRCDPTRFFGSDSDADWINGVFCIRSPRNNSGIVKTDFSRRGHFYVQPNTQH